MKTKQYWYKYLSKILFGAMATAVIFSTETYADTLKKVDCLIPGTGVTCLALVNDLPWKFDVDSKKKDELSNIIYTGSEKVGKQAAILQLRLEVIAFASKKKAGEAFRDRYSMADPDMGLSYAWDFIAVQNMSLYHLHADCILAESNFISATDALTEILAATDRSDSAFFCRCGGPCRMLPQR